MVEAPDRRLETRSLVSGTVVVFGARLAAAGLGLAQVLLLATKFGTSTSADAYFIAGAACMLFVLPIESALDLAFVPVFVHTAETEGERAAWRLGAGVFQMGLLAAGGVTLALAGAAPWLSGLLAPGIQAKAEVAHLIQVMAPLIFFTSSAVFLSSLEYIAGRYWLASSGVVVSSMAGPLALILFADRYGIVCLAWGAVAGQVARCLLLSRPQVLRRVLGQRLSGRDPAMRRLGGTIVSRLLTSWFPMLDLTVDRMFASLLGPGFVSALAYAGRAVGMVVRLFMIPMGRVLLPPVTRLAAREQYPQMRVLFERLVIGLAFVVGPLMAFMVVFRTELLGLLFQRGAFDAAAVDNTAKALLFFALGIMPFLMTPLLTGAFFALQDSATPLKIGFVCTVVNIGLDALLIRQLGHAGVALSTSLVATVGTLLLWIHLERRVGKLQSRLVLGSLLVSGITATFSFWGARGLASLAAPGAIEPLARLAGCAVVGGVGYVLLQAVLNRPVLRLVPAVRGVFASDAPEPGADPR